jgi:restriction system protein
MAVPDFQSLMLPLLKSVSDGREHSIQEIRDHLANEFALTEEDLNQLIPSGVQTVFINRVSWARTYLAKAGLLEITRRSHVRITERGKEVLKQNPPRIDIKFLRQFPEFLEFMEKESDETQGSNIIEEEKRTPEEILQEAYKEIRNNLAQELLTQVKNSSPAFFERLVVELLVKMGYGGSHSEAARAVGKTGDEGIDGIIDEDKLGLDSIYIQAKRWENVVGRPEIQKFVGALVGKRAKKGIFITTSKFTNDAIDFVSTIDTKVVLIDGKRLAELMIDYDVGVATVSNFQIKRVDFDYFSNE